MFYVYGLIDPRDNQIHYVGITQNSPARRLASHISGGASAKDGWLTSMIDAGFLPRITVLQVAETYSEIFELETWWIKIAEQVGWPITNTNKTNRRIARPGGHSSQHNTDTREARRDRGGGLPGSILRSPRRAPTGHLDSLRPLKTLRIACVGLLDVFLT